MAPTKGGRPVIRIASIAIAAGVAVASMAAPAQAQQGKDVRAEGVELKSWVPKYALTDSVLEVWELDEPERLVKWRKDPGAALTMDFEQRFILLDFSLTRGPKLALDDRWMHATIAAEQISVYRRYAKVCTAVSLMFRLKGQEATQRKKIETMGPAMAQPLAVLSNAEFVKERCANLESRLADPEEFESTPESKISEVKRALQGYKQGLQMASARLTDAQRLKLRKLAKALIAATPWKSRVPALKSLLAEKGAKRHPLAFALPAMGSLSSGDAFALMGELDGYDLVYPFEVEGKREEMPDGLTGKALRDWLDRPKKRTPDTTVCVPLPFTLADDAAWKTSKGTLVRVKWSTEELESAVTFDDEELEEPGASGLTEVLAELEGEVPKAVRFQVDPKTHWGDTITMIAALRLAGVEKIVVRGTK